MRKTGLIALLLTWTLMGLGAAPPEGASALDVAGGDDCTLDHASVRDAVIGAHEELRRSQRAPLPGPRGRELVELRVDALLERSIHVDTFVQRVLRHIWELATPEQQARWRVAMDRMLRRRYLKGLDARDRHRLEVQRADVSCRNASVRIVLEHITTGDERVVDMALIYVDGAWRVYDVILDGASLVRTWRSRFTRVYREGGLAAVDAEMGLHAERYRDEGAPSP